jgi:hypothetical protein
LVLSNPEYDFSMERERERERERDVLEFFFFLLIIISLFVKNNGNCVSNNGRGKVAQELV